MSKSGILDALRHEEQSLLDRSRVDRQRAGARRPARWREPEIAPNSLSRRSVTSGQNDADRLATRRRGDNVRSAGLHYGTRTGGARARHVLHPRPVRSRPRQRERTTGADSAAILADFRRRFSDEFGGIGSDRIRVVLPGNEPGAYRVLVCEDADEAAACLHRHWLESQGRAPGRRSRRPANATRRRSFTDIAAAAGSHIQVGTCASVASGCRMTSTLLPGSCWRGTISTHSPLRGWNR